jgi:hypothetical protein
MNINFFDTPPQPKDRVRIEKLDVVVYPDRFRVFVQIHVTLFQERPNLLLVARDSDGRIAAELDIIETMHHEMEFTMHLRGRHDPAGEYTLTADLFYESRNPPQDRQTVAFTVPAEGEQAAEDAP